MKLIHIVPHINEEAAGPSYSIPRLCEGLSVLGNEVELSCLAAKGQIPGVKIVIYPQWPFFKKFAVSTSLPYSLNIKSRTADIVHNHSLWSMINIASGWVVSKDGAKLVTSPRGTLSTWALSQNKLVKKLLWPLQRKVMTRAEMLHATSEAEYSDIRLKGFNSPVTIIPNGIDIPIMPMVKINNKRRQLLFLGRLHPTKCIDRLLYAWKHLQNIFLEWDLVIVGKGDFSYEQYLLKLKIKLNLSRVSFTGVIYGDEKSKAYFNADLFILPSHSENFGIAVAESLAHGCPVVVGKGAPWSQLEEKGCGWWTENDVESLTETLNFSMKKSKAQLEIMGSKGRVWMKKDFEWSLIAKKMDKSYKWLLKGGRCPDWVKLS